MLQKGKTVGFITAGLLMMNSLAGISVSADAAVSGKPELKLDSGWSIQVNNVTGQANEADNFTWEDGDYSVNICDTDGVGDSSSMAVEINKTYSGNKDPNIRIIKPLSSDIPQGSTYKFEFDYKKGNKDNFNADIYGRDFQGAVYGLVGSGAVTRTDIGNGWIHYSGYMTDTNTSGNPINNVCFRIHTRPSSFSSFLIDNFSVKVVTTPASEGVEEVLGGELIVDGGFSNYGLDAGVLYENSSKDLAFSSSPSSPFLREGVVDGNTTDSLATMSYAKDGKTSLLLHHPRLSEVGSQEKQQYVEFYLNSALVQDKEYTLEYSAAGTSDQTKLQAGFIGVNANASTFTISTTPGWGFAAGTSQGTDGMWTTYKKTVTADKSGIEAGLRIRLFQTQQANSDGSTLDYLLDNVTLYATDDVSKTNILINGNLEDCALNVATATTGLIEYGASSWNLLGRGVNANDDSSLTVVKTPYASDGNYALKAHYLTPKASGNAYVRAKGRLTGIAASTTYVIEYTVAGSLDKHNYVRAGFGYGNQGTAENGATRGFLAGTLIESEGIYRTYQVEVTTGSDATEGDGTYDIIQLEGAASADLLIDNVKVYNKADNTKTNILNNGSFENTEHLYAKAELVDASGQPVDSIVQGTNYVRVDPRYARNDNGEYEGIVIVALFNNERMVDSSSTSQITNSVPLYEKLTVSLNLQEAITEDDNYSIRVFYWNNLDSVTPIDTFDVLP